MRLILLGCRKNSDGSKLNLDGGIVINYTRTRPRDKRITRVSDGIWEKIPTIAA
jgi:hypothetical protein